MKIFLLIMYIMLIAPNCQASIVAQVIAGEASGEGREGAYAVACVIQNRMKIKRKTATEIVTQKSQFSAYEWQSARTRFKHYMKDAQYYDKLAAQIEAGTLKDTTKGSTHFYNPRVYPNFTPCWIKPSKYNVTVGNHNFYYYRYF